MSQTPRVLIGVPSRGPIEAATVTSLMGLSRPVPMGFCIAQQTLLSWSRTELAERAMQEGFTHLLFIDSDMTVPPDTVPRLLAANAPIVGANYSTRHPPLRPTARLHGKPLQVEQGVGEADIIGMGCVLISTEVFTIVPQPWFSIVYADGQYVGEDVFFWDRCRQYGLRPLVDHTLEVGHIGTTIHTLERRSTPC